MGTNRQFDKNSRSKTYKEINLFKNLNSQSQSSPRPLPPRIPSPTIPGLVQWPPTRPSDPATDRSTLVSDATMTSSQLRRNTGANRASLARPSSTTASTGPTAATASCSATGQCPRWALENKCKAYKDCQKCVREKHGDTCIGEFVRYTWRYATKRNAFESKDAPGSCQRELFECDLQFVEDTYTTKDVWTEDYHLFWSKTGWDNEDANNCPSGGNGPVEHQCCGG